MKTFRLPDIGEGLQEAEIVSWHVSPGDHVVADQPLVAIETDKAVVEIPSPWPGSIARLYGQVGDVISVGAPLVDFATSEQPNAGAIVGTLNAVGDDSAVPDQAAITPEVAAARAPEATPRVRAYAAQHGVALSAIRGTGPDGTIITSDVDAAIAATREGADGHERLRGPRRALAINMSKAGRTVVPATVTDLVDISAWWNTRTDTTVRAIAAIARAAVAEPSLNVWFDGELMSRCVHDVVDIGVAVDTPDGLFVPVIRNVGQLGDGDIRRCVDDLAQRARARALRPEEMRDATITFSNFGSIAGRHASLVVIPPQVAIVGIGQTEQQLALEAGDVVRRTILPVSLTFDHRAATGGEAARFLAALKSDLQRQRSSPDGGRSQT